MKKRQILCLLFVLVCLFAFCSCSNLVIESNNSETSTNETVKNYSLYGLVDGIKDADRSSSSVVLYNSQNSYVSSLGDNNEYGFERVAEGTYYLKVEVSGYSIPAPYKVLIYDDSHIRHNIPITEISSGEFAYQWRADDTYFGYESSSADSSNKTISFFNEKVNVSDNLAVDQLYNGYQIILSNEDVRWSNDYASRLLATIQTIYNFPNDGETKWVLTKSLLPNDISIQESETGTVVYVSSDAFANANTNVIEYNGLKGTYFSHRLYNAAIRYATDNGKNIDYVNEIMYYQYGCSILISDYESLTGESTDMFEQFKPEELISILSMFAELPDGFDKVGNLQYLVRRADGYINKEHPTAAAVSYPYAENGYIEFMDAAFLSSQYEDTFRLILHEKAHFLWAHVFSDAIKEEWIKIAGWYKTDKGWATHNETEFVSSYAHAHNPDEDMAESIAYYVLMSSKLESRSPTKYAFIRNYIMNGTSYLTQIREDLQFEVYNLYPDYNCPGKINGVDINVSGQPDEDKKVTVTITLDTQGNASLGASYATVRVYSEIGTHYDIHLFAIDDTKSVLKGEIVISKYSCGGNWYANQIKLVDNAGNERYVGANHFGWNMYINNINADEEKATLVPGSLYVVFDHGVLNDNAVTYVNVKFSALDNIGIKSVYCEISNDTWNGYTMSEYGTYNPDTEQGVVKFTFTEFTQSGHYTIKSLILTDYAGNTSEIKKSVSVIATTIDSGLVTLGSVRRFTPILGDTISSQAVNTVLIPSSSGAGVAVGTGVGGVKSVVR